jgi:GT2 family glycosyltransferase
MSQNIDISIITLNYKEAELTKRMVARILTSKKVSLEVLIIDNGNSATDRKMLSSIDTKRVRVLSPGTNLGCGKGYNFGIIEAQGTYVFIVNNDTEIHDALALYKMKRFLDIHSQVAVIQPKIKSLSRSEYYEYAGAAGGYIDLLGYPFCRGRIFNTIEKDVGQYEKTVEISWASTCAFFARKGVLMESGLFDPIYFAYAEEVDLSMKIWNMGYSVMFFPNAEVYHGGESSWKKARGHKIFLIHRNHLVLFYKCFPLYVILLFTPLRLLFEYCSMIFYLFNNSNLHVVSVLFSHLSCFVRLPLIIKKRIEFFRLKSNMSMPIYKSSIVLDYFLFHKKYVRDLNIYLGVKGDLS